MYLRFIQLFYNDRNGIRVDLHVHVHNHVSDARAI